MKRALVLLSAMCVVAGITVAALARSSDGARPPSKAVPEGCPTKTLPLPGDAVARAADQAKIQAPFLYRDVGRIVLVRAERGPWAGIQGDEVKRQCGSTVLRRTVVVDLFFPAMLPSASLSQGTVFVSLRPNGYRVWEVAH